MIKKRWVKPCWSPPACCLSPLCPGVVLAWRCRCSQEESESSLRAAPGFEVHLKPGEALLSPLPTSQRNQPARLGLDFTTSSGSLISIAALVAPEDCLLLHLWWFSWSFRVLWTGWEVNFVSFSCMLLSYLTVRPETSQEGSLPHAQALQINWSWNLAALGSPPCGLAGERWCSHRQCGKRTKKEEPRTLTPLALPAAAARGMRHNGGRARRRPWGRAELGLSSDLLDPQGLASSGAAQGRAQPRAPSMPPIQASLLVSTPFISSDFKLAGVLVVTNQCKTVPWSSTATLLEQKAENNTDTFNTKYNPWYLPVSNSLI